MKAFLYHFLLFTTITTSAQDPLSGRVTDAVSAKPVQFAAVMLSDTLDINRPLVAETDADGKFTLILPQGYSGEVTVRYSGYAPYSQSITASEKPEPLEIRLIPAAEQLDQVVITAKRKAVSVRGDKIIFNIAGLGIGDGNNGLETLRQIAGIKLDKDDNLLYRGNSDVQIMINGRKSMLQGDALREYIRSLKGSDIESVEIIAQPSARYEASGTAGVINIVLKKNRNSGISGNVYVSVAHGEYFKNQNGGQVYYNDSLWNVNAGGSYYDGSSVNHRRVIQRIRLDEDVRTLKQYNEWLPETTSANMNIGVGRNLDRRQLISTQWQYHNSDEYAATYGRTSEYFNQAAAGEVYLTQKGSTPTKRLTGNLYYNFTADSSSTRIDVQFNYANYNRNLSGFQQNDYGAGNSWRLNGASQTDYDIWNGQADIEQRLSKVFSIEAGAKYSTVHMRYITDYTASDPDQLLIPEAILNNEFRYDEVLVSGYAQLSANISNWSFLAGLRAENYAYTAASASNGKTNKGNYTHVFPSLSASYKKNDSQYQFSYSRRIGRPAYLALNPYYEFIDAYTVAKGNPDLKPQLYHSMQLTYIYKSALNISVYGYIYDNGFTSVIDYLETEKYNVTYQANAAAGSRFGISASLPYQFVDWWDMQLGIDAASSFEESNIPGFGYSGRGFGYDLSLYENFKFKNDWSVSWNGNYSGRAETPNGYSRPTYDFSISVKKALLNKKLHLLGGCANILKKNMYSQITEVGNVSTDWENRWETRRFYFQATWYFGGGKAKKVKATSISDETNRIN